MPFESGNGAVEPLVRFDDVWKIFGGRPAVAGVSLDLYPGQVVGLVGPNGAGKSTLIKLLDGVYRADRGRIFPDATEIRQLVGVIHQELGVIDTLTVAENMRLGVPGARRMGVFLRRTEERRIAEDGLARVGLDDISPNQLVGSLTTGEKSLVAIARMLTRDRRVIILDETTAALPARAAKWLYERVRALAADGGSIVVVSHRLGEIIEYCDRIVVLVDGQVAVDRPVAGLDQAAIADAMSGGRITQAARRTRQAAAVAPTGEPVLELQGASGSKFRNVDLQLRAGEVLGVTGLVGSGLYELARVAAGVEQPASGRRVQQGLKRAAYVPPDRRTEGLFVDHPVGWNATIGALGDFVRSGLLDVRRERREATRVCGELRVKMIGIDQPIRELSGGNQQKVLVARSLLLGSNLLVLCEPTRGVDVHTRNEIYALIDRLKSEGSAILVVSSDVEEVLTISDRLGVMRDGEFVEVSGDGVSGTAGLAELVM